MKKFFKLDIFFSAVLIFGFGWMLGVLPFNYNLFDPVVNFMKDFELNDVAFSRVRNEMPADPNIVIVNIGHNTRNEIARQIRIVSDCKPKIIAIDAFFRRRKGPAEDSALISAYRSAGNVVLVSEVVKDTTDAQRFSVLKSSSVMFGGGIVTGFANFLPGQQTRFQSSRKFRLRVPVNDTIEEAFAVQIVRQSFPDKYKALCERGNETELINYRGNFNKFYTLDKHVLDDTTTDLSFLRDKIVIMGFMGDRFDDTLSVEDKFFTPLNRQYAGKTLPDMYGVVIHANIVSMILHGNYIHVIPAWLNNIIAFILCYCSIGICALLRRYSDLWWEGIFVFVLMLETLFILSIDLIFFIVFTTAIDTTLIIVAILFAPNAFQIYSGLVKGMVQQLFRSTRRLLNEHT